MIVASSARDGNPAHVLRVAHLAKHYDHEAAIADVTFSVIPGEVLGIVGPNGAGKTTLLETLAGLLAASSGAVFWRGRELPAPRRKEALFYLPDGVKPYQDRFAAEVVSFFASVYRRSDREVAARIDSVGLAPALGKRVHALSKGYTRRLLLALGLLTPQDVLLMDEPFDGFDLRQTRNIVGGGLSCAHLGHPRYPRLRCIRCSQRSWRRLSAGVRCGPCCCWSARWSDIASLRPCRSIAKPVRRHRNRRCWPRACRHSMGSWSLPSARFTWR